MPLAPGSRLGTHEIHSLLGAGGMGEVYLALDTKLHRRVAIKVLPPEYAADAERLSRFEREAHAVAALNHPHVATIHDFAEDGATKYLVLELVEGPTLAERIEAGPVPLDEALAIGSQVLLALEAAHARGICHRDLKPANIKLTADGTVKVLDFGLAKIREAPGAAVSLTHSPTVSLGATHPGMVMGTAGYMSPEQAKGFEADPRSDIFAFGCVLFELLSGQRAFVADTVAEILASVLKSDLDWSKLPPDLPPRLVEILRRSVEKNPKRRWHSAADLRIELEAAAQNAPIGATIAPAVSEGPWRRRVLPLAAGVAVGALATAAPSWLLRTPPPAATPLVKLSITVPEEHLARVGSFLAISPRGTHVAYSSADGRVFVRALDQLQANALPGEFPGAANLTFSADGQHLAFTGARELFRIPIGGGAATVVGEISTLSDSSGIATGSRLHWSEGAILGTNREGIFRFPETGGAATQIVSLSAGESAAIPQLLPDGDSMLFTVVSGSPNPDWDRARIVVQSIRTGERRVVMEGATDGRYLSTGHLVYAVGGALQAARFDLATSRIVGTPVTVLSGVRRAISVGSLRAEALAVIAENGTLAYVPGPAAFPMSRTIAVIDRDGHERLLPIPPGPYESPRISPDGRFLAYGSVDGRDATIWVYELSGQGAPRRLTFTGNNRYPVWSPDSRRLAFQSDRDAETGIFVQNADGTGQAERLTLAEPGAIHFPESWARVGDRLSFSVLTSSGSALWTVSVAGKEATPFGGVTGIGPHNSAFSPDGGWIAYTSRSEPNGVFVQPVPATGARYQISSTSEIGHHPFWSPDGKELFYLGAERGGLLVGVTLVVANGVTAGKSTVFPRALAANTNATGPSNYDITRDGRSFVGIRGASEALNSPATEIHVVLNWLDELRRLVPVP